MGEQIYKPGMKVGEYIHGFVSSKYDKKNVKGAVRKAKLRFLTELKPAIEYFKEDIGKVKNLIGIVLPNEKSAYIPIF